MFQFFLSCEYGMLLKIDFSKEINFTTSELNGSSLRFIFEFPYAAEDIATLKNIKYLINSNIETQFILISNTKASNHTKTV